MSETLSRGTRRRPASTVDWSMTSAGPARPAPRAAMPATSDAPRSPAAFDLGAFPWEDGGSAGAYRSATASGGKAHRGAAPRKSGGAQARRRGLERGLGLALAALGASVLAAAAFLLLPSVLKVTRYEISGARSLSQAEVLGAALIRGDEYFFSVEPARMKAALEAEPRIAAATVSTRFPNTLRIAITEREAAAIVLVEDGSRLLPVCVDREGVAFAYAAPKADLPVLSGLRFQGFKLGTRLPPAFGPALAALAQIRASAPALLGAFSEIKFVKPSSGELELVLYSLHHRVPVRTGAVLNEATLRSIILVLDVLGSQGLSDKVEEIDFRTGTVVYRVKEGHPG